MSLYGLLFGENTGAEALLSEIGLDRGSFPRYRDCYLNPKNPSEIVVLTRTGGNNRYCEIDEQPQHEYPFDDCIADHADHDCTLACHWDLMNHPSYIKDEDVEWDDTYAEFYFTRAIAKN